jgi:hypothetical protein
MIDEQVIYEHRTVTGTPVVAEVPSQPETTAEDVFIERADLGADTFTLVIAGQPIPAGLEGLPRRKADVVPAPEGAPRMAGPERADKAAGRSKRSRR